MSSGRRAHIIVLGNEKGGSGKSTTAMHVVAALLEQGRRVATIDLDGRQRTLTRYLDNRAKAVSEGVNLLMPSYAVVTRSEEPDFQAAQADERNRFLTVLEDGEKAVALVRLGGLEIGLLAAGHHGIGGHQQVHALGHRLGAVVEVAGQGALAAVQVDGSDPTPLLQQRGDHMHRRGGLARAALFIAQDDDMCPSPAAHESPSES